MASNNAAIIELLMEVLPIGAALAGYPMLPPEAMKKIGSKLTPLLEPKKTDRNVFKTHKQLQFINSISDRQFRVVIMNILTDGRYEDLGHQILDAFFILGPETFPKKDTLKESDSNE